MMGLLSALGGSGGSPFPAMSGIGAVQRIISPSKDSDDEPKKKRRKKAKKRAGRLPKHSLLAQVKRSS